MNGWYNLFADIVLVVHLFFVLFAVGGQVFILAGAALKWNAIRNPLFRVGHLLAVGLVGIEAATGIDCPLTVWEYSLRHLAGLRVDQNLSFVARLVHLVIFYDLPEWVFTILHLSFGILVVLTYVLIPPHFRKKR
jgi:hypothetical protein